MQCISGLVLILELEQSNSINGIENDLKGIGIGIGIGIVIVIENGCSWEKKS